MSKTVTPYNSDGTKAEQVEQMFDNIAPKYDFLNRTLSFGVDIVWRKIAVNKLKKLQPKYILDIATGTSDLAIEAMKLHPEKIIGIDISEGMLQVGREKIKQKKLSEKIFLQKADSENIPFKDNEFDAAMVSFGVRNFEHLEKGLKEINRVLKPGGMLMILEFSQPESFPIKQLYGFYSKRILPKVGNSISKDNAAYSYLPESVEAFPHGKRFLEILASCGYKNGKQTKLTFGIASIYTGIKAS